MSNVQSEVSAIRVATENTGTDIREMKQLFLSQFGGPAPAPPPGAHPGHFHGPGPGHYPVQVHPPHTSPGLLGAIG